MTTTEARPLSFSMYGRLSMMMLLQYAIWGAWLPLLFPFLSVHRHFSATQIGHMFAIGAVGAILAPFVAGQIADRFFPTQIYLGLSHLVGGVLVWQLAAIESYGAFLVFSLVYSLVYSPTLPLTNSLAFHHLPDRDRDFGRVRVWGTLGWIVVGIGIGHWLMDHHTPSREAAAAIIVEQRIGDANERHRLLESSEVVGKDGSTAIGRVSHDGDVVVVDVEGDSHEVVRYAAGNVERITPLYEKLAAKGRAVKLRTLLEGLDGGAVVASAIDLTAADFSEESESAVIGARQAEGMSDAFRLSAILGVLMGLFCLFGLPNTPPAREKRSNATMQAMRAVRQQPLITLFVLAVPVSCIHQFYFVHTAQFLGKFQLDSATWINKIFGVGGGGLMVIGQVVELAVLSTIPAVAKKVSRKALLATGLIAYGLRMAIFAYYQSLEVATSIPSEWILMIGVGLHGFCFGCFIFVAFMVVDEETSGDVRASAQSLFNLVIVGIGTIVGSMIASAVSDWAHGVEAEYHTRLFSVPMWASVVTLGVLMVFYPGGRRALD